MRLPLAFFVPKNMESWNMLGYVSFTPIPTIIYYYFSAILDKRFGEGISRFMSIMNYESYSNQTNHSEIFAESLPILLSSLFFKHVKKSIYD